MPTKFKIMIPIIILSVLMIFWFIETNDWLWFIISMIVLVLLGFFVLTDEPDAPLIIEEKQFSIHHITKMKTIQYADIKEVNIHFGSKKSNSDSGTRTYYVELSISYNKYSVISVPHSYSAQYHELINELKKHPHIQISEVILNNEEQLLELIDKWLNGSTIDKFNVSKIEAHGVISDYAKEKDITYEEAKGEVIKISVMSIGCFGLLIFIYIFIAALFF